MSWEKWVLAAFEAAGALFTVTQVGKPRKAVTGGVAAVALVITAGLIALVVFA